MSVERLYVDTIGFEFNLTVIDDDTEDPIDISEVNGTLTLDVEKPNGDKVVWSPSIIDGPNGIAQYKTVAGNLDQVGTYTIQGHWDPVSAGEDFWSDMLTVTVRNRAALR
jgi:hypothetical protein